MAADIGSRSGRAAASITFTGLTADVRTYLMPVRPFTFAFRGLYFARYGNDAEDLRLPTLYLGYPGLVRGYASGSFETGECGLQADGSCPTFDRLLGSRVAIFNAEIRFPLWGALGGSNFYGPLPIEMAVFADSGVAWGQSTSMLYGGNQKEPVSSVGVGDARQPVRVRGRRDRFRPSTGPSGPRLALAVQFDSGVLTENPRKKTGGREFRRKTVFSPEPWPSC